MSVPVAPPSDAGGDRSPGWDDAVACRLIGRVAAGEEPAFAALYDLAVPRVYGLALRITRNHASAEEVAEDTFLQVWRDARRYDAARGKAIAWLLTICRSRALDALRRRDVATVHPEPETLAGAPADSAALPHDLLAATERDTAIHAALTRLSPLQRQLIGLAFFRGLTHQEIAAHSRLPLGTVKTHLRKALAELRALLGPDGLAGART